MSDDTRTDADFVEWSIDDQIPPECGYDTLGCAALIKVFGRFPGERRSGDRVPDLTMFLDKQAFITHAQAEVIELVAEDGIWAERAHLASQIDALQIELSGLRAKEAELKAEQDQLKKQMPHDVALQLARVARRLAELKFHFQSVDEALGHLQGLWDDLDDRVDSLLDFALEQSKLCFTSRVKAEATQARRALERAIQPFMAQLYKTTEAWRRLHQQTDRLSGAIKAEVASQLTRQADSAPILEVANVVSE